MLAQRIEKATRDLGKPQEWNNDEQGHCSSLPIRDVIVQGVPFMVSAWAPTPAELAALNRGETLKVWVAGYDHPPIAVTVGDFQE